MWPNPQETADLVLFTEETLHGKRHFIVQWMFILCSCYIVYHVPRVCLVSCNLLQNATILGLLFLVVYNKQDKSRSQDWIILFFIIFLFTYLVPCNVFRFMLFLPQQDFVNCRYFWNCKILETKVKSFFWTVLLELLIDVIFFFTEIFFKSTIWMSHS